ncbi:MAG TPA: preprotein translocase subunit SecE [Thermotogota bacterium]|nr:preprotein translocase subunit SecE [Thermotogota bacterium]HRS79841.1 preprotein translocase subunit SecE [Thermotogota bacterium]HRU36722.1 preprotein translocase subunit SecE [Thermotogota bacterium]
MKKPSKIKKFYREIQVEIKSTTWPNRKVLFSTAGVVAVLLAVMGVYFGLLDFAFSTLTKYLLVLLGIG